MVVQTKKHKRKVGGEEGSTHGYAIVGSQRVKLRLVNVCLKLFLRSGHLYLTALSCEGPLELPTKSLWDLEHMA